MPCLHLAAPGLELLLLLLARLLLLRLLLLLLLLRVAQEHEQLLQLLAPVPVHCTAA
jgi:hypothetical protein